MQLSAILLASAALLTPALADGIFAMYATITTGDSTTVTIEVLNGNVGDAPTCTGTDTQGPVPVAGTIPCNNGYALSYTWDGNQNDGIAATYTNNGNTFLYNIPNTGFDGNDVYQFQFVDNFPGKKMRALRV
jgi:hypothetical protein